MTAPTPLPGAEDTIAAIATARGRSALAVVRLSGPEARRIGAAVLTPFHAEAGRAFLAELRSPAGGATIDRVIATSFHAPRSFTGEEMLELTTHGGLIVPALALEALLAAGAREALPGEFTRRAVANGKLDLLQAEAAADLVDARSPAMHRAALRQLEGGLTSRVGALRESVLALEALLAYELDFPEEDDGPLPRREVGARVAQLRAELDTLLASARTGEIVRDGAVVVLAGPPNSGKSSLFNALVGSARAIVTDIPGTTRDALEATIEIAEWPVRLVDTAGLREGGADIVEQLGIEVTHRYLARADLVLLCGESPELLARARRGIAALRSVPTLAVWTKSDLVPQGDLNSIAPEPAAPIPVSARTGAGLGALGDAIAATLVRLHPVADGAAVLLTRERHRRGVERAREEIAAFITGWEAGELPAPVLAVHLRAAGSALEELIGVVEREDVLDVVFRTFCIGK